MSRECAACSIPDQAPTSIVHGPLAVCLTLHTHTWVSDQTGPGTPVVCCYTLLRTFLYACIQCFQQKKASGHTACARLGGGCRAGFGRAAEDPATSPLWVLVRVVQARLWHSQQAFNKGAQLSTLGVGHAQEGLPIQRVRDGEVLGSIRPVPSHCSSRTSAGNQNQVLAADINALRRYIPRLLAAAGWAPDQDLGSTVAQLVKRRAAAAAMGTAVAYPQLYDSRGNKLRSMLLCAWPRVAGSLDQHGALHLHVLCYTGSL
jgi:hypothetical protein